MKGKMSRLDEKIAARVNAKLSDGSRHHAAWVGIVMQCNDIADGSLMIEAMRTFPREFDVALRHRRLAFGRHGV